MPRTPAQHGEEKPSPAGLTCPATRGISGGDEENKNVDYPKDPVKEDLLHTYGASEAIVEERRTGRVGGFVRN